MNILVTGAGGFIGGHLVMRLMKEGHTLTCADIKPKEYWFQYINSFELRGNIRRDLFDSFIVKFLELRELWPLFIVVTMRENIR